MRETETTRRGNGAALVLAATLALAWAFFPTPGASQSPEAGLAEAREAFLTGAYEDALEAYEERTASAEAPAEAWRGRARVLLRVGRYDEAEAVARRGAEATGGPQLWTLLGHALRRVGRTEEADEAYRRAVEEGASDALTARLERARLRFHRGEREEALAVFDSFIDVYNRNPDLPPRDRTAVATAVQYLGRSNPDLFRDALRAYDEAIAADSALLEPRVLLGELFLEKYNGADARSTFEEALARDPRHPGALVGMARTLDFDHDRRAAETARRALETNPNHVPARTFLARVHLEVERYDAAEEEARRALEVNPRARETLAVLAAAHWLRDDREGYREVASRFDAAYPGSPELGLTVAELAATHRRYAEARAHASDAVERDPQAWEAVGLLGLNQLRLGAIEEGRASLERAFEGDPFNVWFKNTLDLLDTFEEYETRRTPHFELVLHRSEAGALAPYVAEVAEEAYREMVARYGVEPPTPIRVEVFPRHADFSVRTVGLAGIGALGVSFGPVVVLDSPSAQDRGSFNWASVLWHEIAHSFHMALSRNRVPRWFSEGLAVRDQHRTGRGWGHGPGTTFLRAYEEGRLPSATRLNDGFMRPEFPGQVVLSYYQASQVLRFVEEEWGDDAPRRLLAGYGAGQTTAQVLSAELGLGAEAFDAAFDEWLRERFAGPLEAVASPSPVEAPSPPETTDPDAPAPDPQPPLTDAEAARGELEAAVEEDPDDFVARLLLGAHLREAGELEEAAEHLEAALRLFPEFAGPDGPHWQLALLRRDQGRRDEALEHLARLREVDESHLEGALLEAELREAAGDAQGAVRALERAREIAPLQIELHQRMAGHYAALGRREAAVREREAVVALEPVDLAQAYYALARARRAAGDNEGARDALLRALERAPRFQEALDLLLELRSRGTTEAPDTTSSSVRDAGP